MGTASAAEAPPRPQNRLTPPADADMKWLAGEWAVRHVETAGDPLFTAKDLDGARITFQGDRAEVDGFRLLFVRNFSFKLAPDGISSPRSFSRGRSGAGFAHCYRAKILFAVGGFMGLADL